MKTKFLILLFSMLAFSMNAHADLFGAKKPLDKPVEVKPVVKPVSTTTAASTEASPKAPTEPKSKAKPKGVKVAAPVSSAESENYLKALAAGFDKSTNGIK